MGWIPVWIEEDTSVRNGGDGDYTLFAETMLRPTPPAFVEIRKTNMCGSLLNLSTVAVPSIRKISGREYVLRDPLIHRD